MMKIFDLTYQGIDQFDQKKLAMTRKAWSTLVVDPSVSAQIVANIVDLNKFPMVMVVDPSNHIRGVLSPDFITKTMSQRLGVKATSFTDAIAKLTLTNKTLDWANAKPNMLWCEKGRHYTSKKPCPEHP